MNRTGARAIVGAVVGTVMLTACHGGGSSPNPSGSPTGRSNGFMTATATATAHPTGAEAGTLPAQDKCRIVSATAVKAVVGATLIAETFGVSGVGNPVCMFELSKAPSHQVTRIVLSANQSGTRARFRTTKARTVGAKTIAALGDDAFYVKKTSTLQFIKGAKVVIIQATLRKVAAGAVGAPSPAVLVKLARAILAQ